MEIADETLNDRPFSVTQRLHRLYQTFNVAGAVLAALSLAVLTFDQSRPADSSMTRAAEDLLTSCALTSVVSAMTATMLLFKFDGCERTTRKDLVIAWPPLVLLDLAIVEFFLGLVFYCAAKNNLWRTSLLGTQLALLLGYCVWLSVWMWATKSDAGGMSSEEGNPVARKTQENT